MLRVAMALDIFDLDLSRTGWTGRQDAPSGARERKHQGIAKVQGIVIFLYSASSAAELVFYLPGVCTH